MKFIHINTKNQLSSFQNSSLRKLSPWFITLRTFSAKRGVIVFVYSKKGNFYQFSSIVECSKALNLSRSIIHKSIKLAQPYKNYLFSLVLLKPDY